MTDTAKELLALADRIVKADAIEIVDTDMIDRNLDQRELNLIVSALRLSARQQASARSFADAILDAPVGSATAMARALLAKYDIFEKAEG